jgi:hypothetical protein
VQRVGDVVQRLRRVAEAVQQQHGAPRVRVAVDRPRPFDDAVGSDRESRRDAVSECTRRSTSPPDGGGQRRRDRDQ